jgi:hypothetical protein
MDSFLDGSIGEESVDTVDSGIRSRRGGTKRIGVDVDEWLSARSEELSCSRLV